MKPFSDNIIFWDSEFTDLNPYKGEILSLGFIKMDGTELYMEVEYEGEVSDWVKENIMPTLTRPKIARDKVMDEIAKFIGPTRPFMVSYVNQFDTVYLYKLFKTTHTTKEYPFHWIQIDYASMLFAAGIDPERFNIKNPQSLAKELNLDLSNYKEHNALDDARLLRDFYLKFLDKQ